MHGIYAAEGWIPICAVLIWDKITQGLSGNSHLVNLVASNHKQLLLNHSQQSVVLLILKTCTSIRSHQSDYVSMCRHFSLGKLPWYLTLVFLSALGPSTSSHILSWWKWDLAAVLASILRFLSPFPQPSLIFVCHAWAAACGDLLASVIRELGSVAKWCSCHSSVYGCLLKKKNCILVW